MFDMSFFKKTNLRRNDIQTCQFSGIANLQIWKFFSLLDVFFNIVKITQNKTRRV